MRCASCGRPVAGGRVCASCGAPVPVDVLESAPTTVLPKVPRPSLRRRAAAVPPVAPVATAHTPPSPGPTTTAGAPATGPAARPERPDRPSRVLLVALPLLALAVSGAAVLLSQRGADDDRLAARDSASAATTPDPAGTGATGTNDLAPTSGASQEGGLPPDGTLPTDGTAPTDGTLDGGAAPTADPTADPFAAPTDSATSTAAPTDTPTDTTPGAAPGTSAPTTAPTAQTQTGAVPQAPFFTVVAASRTEAAGGRAAVEALVPALTQAGYPTLVFFSSDYGSLNPGYWVLGAGPFADAAAAEAEVPRLRAAAPDFALAYDRCVGSPGECPGP